MSLRNGPLSIGLNRALCAAVVAWLSIPLQVVAEEEPPLPPPAKKQVDFVTEIKPLLEASCYSCHGPEKQESSLRLDKKSAALAGGDLGPAYVPGKSAESDMVRYIAGIDESIVMPPDDSGFERLTPEQVGLVRAWIDQGANWPADASSEPDEAVQKDPRDHWSFRRPVRPNLPEVRNAKWPRNAIDAFVLARLEEADLTPEQEADRYTLLRRLSLDLTGLPPTAKEVEAFLADNSEDAYEKQVERQLNSPHYGERWALWWLDVARYADTNGYEIDRPRSIWPYRDWVIAAFNSHMRFDQFVIEQIAGDLLPNATLSQRIATGFHRNTFHNEEGGHDAEQFRWESIVDRASTTGTAFLGLTMGCAQCHNHKYDPIAQSEFYEFFAFLNNDDEPRLEVPQPDITKRRNELLAEIAELEVSYETEYPIPEEMKNDKRPKAELRQQAIEAAFEKWRKEAAKEARRWVLLEPISWKSQNSQTLTKLKDQSLLASGNFPEVDSFEVVYPIDSGKITGIKLETLPDVSLPEHGPGRGYYVDDGTFHLSEIIATVTPQEGAESKDLVLANPTATSEKRKKEVSYALDGNKHTGWHINEAGQRQCAVFEVAEPVESTNAGKLTVTLLQNMGHAQTIGRFRMWVTDGEFPLQATSMPVEVEQTLTKPVEEWTPEERESAKRYYLSIAPELKLHHEAIARRLKKLPAVPTTLVLKELAKPRTSHQHIRGDYRRPGPVVTPNVPRFLHPLPDGPRNRLTLAKWLVDEENPLIARVIVNQIWQCYFGRGLVNTPEDFGFQGALPSHPELLDWLACEFMDSGWDIEHLHRLIVTSATYRQSSRVSPEKLQADPENILLSRGARFRLPAELVRDVALESSGLLQSKIGGPSVFPSQPAGVTEASFSKFKWPSAEGDDRYRRALYTFRKRSAMYAAYSLFDAPPQNICTMRRVRSNTPLQGLALLNDELMIEAAQSLAADVVNHGPTAERSKLEYAFQRCLTRPPTKEEVDALADYAAAQLQHFQTNATDAATVAGVEPTDATADSELAELATWTMVSRALLNLDETISKE